MQTLVVMHQWEVELVPTNSVIFITAFHSVFILNVINQVDYCIELILARLHFYPCNKSSCAYPLPSQ